MTTLNEMPIAFSVSIVSPNLKVRGEGVFDKWPKVLDFVEDMAQVNDHVTIDHCVIDLLGDVVDKEPVTSYYVDPKYGD